MIQAAARRPPALATDLAISVALLLPMLLPRLPLLDLPGHLAIEHILAGLPDDPAYARFYLFQPAVMGNLALHWFVLLARQVMPIDLAVRIFCALIPLMLFWGSRAVAHRLVGTQARAWRFAALFAYGGPLQFGFVDFCFGVGLALLVFALWLRWRAAPLWRQCALLLLPATAVLLSHLAAFGALGVAVGAILLAEVTSGPRPFFVATARATCWLLPPLLLVALGAGNQPGSDLLMWATPRQKLEALAAITMFAYPAYELALLGLLLSAGLLGWIGGHLHPTRAGWSIAVCFALVFVLLPRDVAGAGLVDYRLPWAASFFIVAAIAPSAPHRWRILPLGAVGGLLIAARIVLILLSWRSWQNELAGIDAALGALPRGAVLMVAEGDPGSESLARRPPLRHVAAYATAHAAAFEPNGFAGLAGQLVALRPPWRDLWRVKPPPAIDQLDPRATHLLVLRPELVRLAPDIALHAIAQGIGFVLYER